MTSEKGAKIDRTNRLLDSPKSNLVPPFCHNGQTEARGWLMIQSGKASLQTNPTRQRGRTLNSSRFAASPSLARRVSFVGHSLSFEEFASRELTRDRS
jgi:hypothetical protein